MAAALGEPGIALGEPGILGRFPVGVDCSLKDSVRYCFLGHSGHMAELT